MKKNLQDYRKEMKELQARSESLQRGASVEAYRRGVQRGESYPNVPHSPKWVRALLPALMAILSAIIALALIILSEALKKG